MEEGCHFPIPVPGSIGSTCSEEHIGAKKSTQTTQDHEAARVPVRWDCITKEPPSAPKPVSVANCSQRVRVHTPSTHVLLQDSRYLDGPIVVEDRDQYAPCARIPPSVLFPRAPCFFVPSSFLSRGVLCALGPQKGRRCVCVFVCVCARARMYVCGPACRCVRSLVLALSVSSPSGGRMAARVFKRGQISPQGRRLAWRPGVLGRLLGHRVDRHCVDGPDGSRECAACWALWPRALLRCASTANTDGILQWQVRVIGPVHTAFRLSGYSPLEGVQVPAEFARRPRPFSSGPATFEESGPSKVAKMAKCRACMGQGPLTVGCKPGDNDRMLQMFNLTFMCPLSTSHLHIIEGGAS